MYTVRLCFAATVAFLVVVIGWWTADAVVCCNSSLVKGGGERIVRSCPNKNRTFHMVETIGDSACDENRTAVPVRKCCPPGRLYDPKVQFCGPSRADRDEYLQRMMQRLSAEFRVVADAVMVGYDYEQPICNATQVLVDVPVMEVRGLMETGPPAIELPPGYCFDLTPSDELVAQTCRPRDQYCGRDGYTCVRKCCKRDHMFVDGGGECKRSEKPFTMSAYETDADGRPVGQSNSTVLPYYLQLECSNRNKVDDGFMLTTDGSLYLNGDGKRVPETRYCVEYNATADRPQALICAKGKRFNWKRVFYWISPPVVSFVFAMLTLLVYAILPSLRNVQGYYFIWYLASVLMVNVCEMIDLYKLYTVLKDPYSLSFYGCSYSFFFMATVCWLHVLSVDIYWTIKCNKSIYRNTSTSVRTIMYHIYCWGFSSIGVIPIFYFLYSNHKIQLQLTPYIGDILCFFFDCPSLGSFIFLYIHLKVIVITNLILFLLTAIHYSRTKSELNKFNPTDSKTERLFVYKERFVMNIKLFLIMGISNFSQISDFQKNSIIILFCNFINQLHPVFVFIILVAKRRVIMDLRKTFRGLMNHSESTPINTITGSS
ncbi:G-protein coupled receptor Mth-like [Metopolophium dirhodum]|uniref:G-protein coupled receptor Mth-like n=1 Tax=Metopolophium dirhodum TaxID=44670 RepID=UPI00298FFCF6|nr:G-protein coupled receptor Mth-like [Metopolophium dirhodum]